MRVRMCSRRHRSLRSATPLRVIDWGRIMTHELTLKLGKQRPQVVLEPRTVVLCNDAADAARTAKAVADAGGTLLAAADPARGTVRDQLPKKSDPARVQDLCAQLHLPEDVLEWRPRDTDALHRLVAETVVALVADARVLVFDCSELTSPFDVAHLCAHMRRTALAFDVTVVAVVWDAALISSAGTHLIVMDADAVAETGPAIALLANPRSDALQQRLAATPIASPLAMQMRRVQRVATEPVNYAHTTIIALPTRDTIALAGGDE